MHHVIVFGERHLRHRLRSYLAYYNETRTYLSLDKDAPISRGIEAVGRIFARPVLGGLLICDRHSQFMTYRSPPGVEESMRRRPYACSPALRQPFLSLQVCA